MLSIEQNHIDCEFNGGYSAIGESELINLRPSSGQTLLNAHQIQQPTISPAATAPTKQNATLVQSNSNSKKSVMLNFKSGAINSTVEEFGNFSTRFSDTFTQNGRRYRFWPILLAAGITLSCLCCFVFGLSFNYLFDTQPCGGKLLSINVAKKFPQTIRMKEWFYVCMSRRKSVKKRQGEFHHIFLSYH